MDNTALLDYQVRISKKAKRPQIAYTSVKGIEVIIPEKSKIDIDKFIQLNKSWLLKQIKKNPKQEFFYPKNIFVKFLQKEYAVSYLSSKGKCSYIERPGSSIVIVGNITENNFKKTIKLWLFNLARAVLLPCLDSISKDIKIDYRYASIRGQTGIWGSCSANKDISINYKLLFLPKHLSRYVLIHELCHTVYLDHSSKFWQLVSSYDKNYAKNKKELCSYARLNFSWLD